MEDRMGETTLAEMLWKILVTSDLIYSALPA